jgi:hypothetical protein
VYQQMKNRNVSRASLLLLLLLSADFVFNLLHISKHVFVPNSSAVDVRISAYLEIYHLVKLFWIIILFVYLIKSTRSSGYISWIIVFMFLLVDDAFLLHQKIGKQFAVTMNAFIPFPTSLAIRYFELAVLAIAGIILCAILAWGYFRSTDVFRKISRDILLFMVALVFFGLIVDVAAVFSPGSAMRVALDIFEDAGEMVVFSLILWYVFLLALRSGKPGLTEKGTLTSSYEIK